MIIGDSSALISLSILDKLDLLEKLYDKLYVPQAVYAEVTELHKFQSVKLKSFLKDKVKVVDLKITKLGLGIGELEAITLYKELDADVLLIDDNRAKKYATLNDIKVIGSLGVLVKAKEKGHIESIKPLLKKLQATDIFISDKLVNTILGICGEN